MSFRVRAMTLALLASAAPAWADSSPLSATAQATASVANACVIVSADSLAFGGYVPLSDLASTGSGQIALRCTKGASFTVRPAGARPCGARKARSTTRFTSTAP